MPIPPTETPVSSALDRRRFFFREVDQLRSLFGAITPNWYASIMGTGIVANAAATLPLQFPALHVAATALWLITAMLLVLLTAATAIHWIEHPVRARGYFTHPIQMHFFGAPPMAFLTVGAGTLLLGVPVLGEPTAVIVSATLWTIGTVMGLACAAYVTYTVFTSAVVSLEDAFGGWLMPIVPPMVSAAGGALLLPHVPDGQPRLTLLLACYAMFGLTLISAFLVIAMLWTKLVRHGIGPAAMVPTLWIVLGPLGQSITAANLLGGAAAGVVSEPYASSLAAFGVVYGLPVLGFALFWACLAAGATIRAARSHLPFSLTWWSFTFPVGTCVTGATGLALHTGSDALAVLAVVLYAGLLVAWITAATRTFHGSLITGRLLVP